MLVDVRWVVLVVAAAGAVYLARKQERWIAPITVGVAVAGLLFVLLRL